MQGKIKTIRIGRSAHITPRQISGDHRSLKELGGGEAAMKKIVHKVLEIILIVIILLIVFCENAR